MELELELELRWFRSARRHRVGKAHALQVMASVAPARVPPSDDADARLVGIGAVERSVEPEIVTFDLHDAVVVIHVMPTALHRRRHE